ncbi:hypothetical protein HELRODRAFT_191760 [Helobdella robusta]|uniref:Uncharacterized protein n=1 Tax=Helobdella robusta TaxID=6412 RepID=T1FTA4_HELRO|nr:hypothetical protein HELRODRAFT_191760 [Helobdella robusta]ESO04317.1 hypothetical protein HELRODRAFT_191760 [Helobdella robusta]
MPLNTNYIIIILSNIINIFPSPIYSSIINSDQCFRPVTTISGKNICLVGGTLYQPISVSEMCEVECSFLCRMNLATCIGFNCRYAGSEVSCEMAHGDGGSWEGRYVVNKPLAACCRFYSVSNLVKLVKSAWAMALDDVQEQQDSSTVKVPCPVVVETEFDFRLVLIGSCRKNKRTRIYMETKSSVADQTDNNNHPCSGRFVNIASNYFLCSEFVNGNNLNAINDKNKCNSITINSSLATAYNCDNNNNITNIRLLDQQPLPHTEQQEVPKQRPHKIRVL